MNVASVSFLVTVLSTKAIRTNTLVGFLSEDTDTIESTRIIITRGELQLAELSTESSFAFARGYPVFIFKANSTVLTWIAGALYYLMLQERKKTFKEYKIQE